MRDKEFNRNAVLETCITMFWKDGFGGCSIKNIVDATRVNRFSLYSEFDSKEGILIASLQLYRERYINDKLALLSSHLPLKERLMQFFTSYLVETDKRPPGCYIIHIATEVADQNEEVKAYLDNYMLELDTAFIKALSEQKPTSEAPSFYSGQLLSLFCTSISFCLIHTPQKRMKFIDNSIQIILTKVSQHAENVT